MVVNIRMGITTSMGVGTTTIIITIGIVGVGATRDIGGRMIIRWRGMGISRWEIGAGVLNVMVVVLTAVAFGFSLIIRQLGFQTLMMVNL